MCSAKDVGKRTNWALKGEIEYLKGRLKFGNSQNSAPFASAIIKYRPLIPHYGIFPDFDIAHEINIWGKDRILTMAPWLLPYLHNDRMKSSNQNSGNKNQFVYRR